MGSVRKTSDEGKGTCKNSPATAGPRQCTILRRERVAAHQCWRCAGVAGGRTGRGAGGSLAPTPHPPVHRASAHSPDLHGETCRTS